MSVGGAARVLPERRFHGAGRARASPASTTSPHDQIKEQLRLTIETIKENQESELINNASTACWREWRTNSASSSP
ncbi:MAG: hypothetical protein U1E77_00290 [Inhella sp.]